VAVGSNFTFFVNGETLILSGEGVKIEPRHGEGDTELGGVSLRVSLFLGDVRTPPSLVAGSRSRPFEFAWVIMLSLARCICCLSGVWLMSGE